MKDRSQRTAVAAFTLIELLVVIAILALLVSLLMPSLQKAKELAVLTKCLSGHRGMAIAYALYASDYDGVNPGSVIPGVWDRFWPECYRAYETNSLAFRCPKNRGGYYGLYSIYGQLWKGTPTLDAVFMLDWGWFGYGQGFQNELNPYPTNFLMLACSSVGQGSMLAYGSPDFLPYIFWSSGGGWTRQGIWLSHEVSDGVAGGMFADGHAESCPPDRLLKTANWKQKNQPSSGGCKAWKLPDGWSTTDGGTTYLP